MKRIVLALLLLLTGYTSAQPPQPMPKGPPGRGYKPLTDADRARLHAEAKAMHGDRLASIAKFQSLPAAFDTRDKGWGIPVGDQGQCGSCYLCSTCITASAAFVKAGYGKPDGSFSLAWQFGMDCQDFGGCDGGNGTEVIAYIVKYGWPADSYVDLTGLTHHDYPSYEAQTGNCRKVTGAKLWKPSAWGFCTGDQSNRKPTIAEIKTAMFNYGMLNVAIDAGGQFGNGTGTITSLGKSIDHEINAVAWDDTKDGGSFLLQNQWNKSWGVDGFRWVTYKAAANIVDWFWVAADPLPPPTNVSVPNVVGMKFADAKAICAAVGLSCNLAAGADATQLIVSQAPVSSTQVALGSIITVMTGAVPPPPNSNVTLTISAPLAAGTYKVVPAKAVLINGDMTLTELIAALNEAAGTKGGDDKVKKLEDEVKFLKSLLMPKEKP